MRYHQALSVLLTTLFIASVTGCGDDEEVESCVVAWASDYSLRFPSGQTAFLPAILDSAACAGATWRLDAVPSASTSELFESQEHARFTPVALGAYEFSLQGVPASPKHRVSFEVIDALERPFHNYNYFAGPGAMAVVGSELWVAGCIRRRLRA